MFFHLWKAYFPTTAKRTHYNWCVDGHLFLMVIPFHNIQSCSASEHASDWWLFAIASVFIANAVERHVNDPRCCTEIRFWWISAVSVLTGHEYQLGFKANKPKRVTVVPNRCALIRTHACKLLKNMWCASHRKQSNYTPPIPSKLVRSFWIIVGAIGTAIPAIGISRKIYMRCWLCSWRCAGAGCHLFSIWNAKL